MIGLKLLISLHGNGGAAVNEMVNANAITALVIEFFILQIHV